jgi:hypothetical protein
VKTEQRPADACRVATSVSEWTEREFEGKAPLAHARSHGVELNSERISTRSRSHLEGRSFKPVFEDPRRAYLFPNQDRRTDCARLHLRIRRSDGAASLKSSYERERVDKRMLKSARPRHADKRQPYKESRKTYSVTFVAASVSEWISGN